MLLLKKPSTRQIQSFLEQQAQVPLSYPEVGLTASQPPAGYAVDHTRVLLGQGEPVFAAARQALQRWQQFGTGWLEIWSPDTPIARGEVVAIVARSVGLWWLNACRIVYVVDETGRFGFAYGTLPDHAGTGEERFLVELDEDGAVWYDILAFSRPQHSLAKVGYPFVRVVQKRFGRDSAAAMRRSVQDVAG